jgi:hypothetical protein
VQPPASFEGIRKGGTSPSLDVPSFSIGSIGQTSLMADTLIDHEHADCERVLQTRFKTVCECAHTRSDHHDADDGPGGCAWCDCTRYVVKPDGKPYCGIEEQRQFPAVHAIKGVTGWRLYCDPCFIDIYGPHNCERLGCKSPETCAKL